MTRLTSDMWVKALVRRVFVEGGFAAIERVGSPEAGAIFIRVRNRNGGETLLAPAPQSLFEPVNSGDRLFERRNTEAQDSDADALLMREAEFDPDLWIVEIETDNPEAFVEITADPPDV